jgi:hypothetical protein
LSIGKKNGKFTFDLNDQTTIHSNRSIKMARKQNVRERQMNYLSGMAPPPSLMTSAGKSKLSWPKIRSILISAGFTAFHVSVASCALNVATFSSSPV